MTDLGRRERRRRAHKRHGRPEHFTYTIGSSRRQYRLAYTCDSDAAEVDANEANLPEGKEKVVTFTPADGVEVTVTAEQTATVDFPPQ